LAISFESSNFQAVANAPALMISLYIQNPTNEPTKAILKQFAPMAVIPPSPMTSAWIINEMETAISADHGPRRMATSVAPDI